MLSNHNWMVDFGIQSVWFIWWVSRHHGINQVTCLLIQPYGNCCIWALYCSVSKKIIPGSIVLQEKARCRPWLYRLQNEICCWFCIQLLRVQHRHNQRRQMTAILWPDQFQCDRIWFKVGNVHKRPMVERSEINPDGGHTYLMTFPESMCNVWDGSPHERPPRFYNDSTSREWAQGII